MVCSDPESDTDHCLKEVNACLIWHRVDAAQGSYHKDVCANFDQLLEVIFIIDKHVCGKDSSAKGIRIILNNRCWYQSYHTSSNMIDIVGIQ